MTASEVIPCKTLREKTLGTMFTHKMSPIMGECCYLYNPFPSQQKHFYLSELLVYGNCFQMSLLILSEFKRINNLFPLKKETLAQVSSRELCEIFNNFTFLFRTPLMNASDGRELTLSRKLLNLTHFFKI